MTRLIKSFIIRWNNEYPLDKAFREKYKIPFNSPQHREINQMDILYEFYEDSLIKESIENQEERNEKQKLFEKGVWLNENISSSLNEDRFDDIDISAFNKEVNE